MTRRDLLFLALGSGGPPLFYFLAVWLRRIGAKPQPIQSVNVHRLFEERQRGE